MTPKYHRKIQVNGQPSGNVLLKIITKIARPQPQTPVSVQMLKNIIIKISDKMTKFGCDKMTKFGQDVEKLNAYVINQIQGLAAFG
jgi:hypothetical protein